MSEKKKECETTRRTEIFSLLCTELHTAEMKPGYCTVRRTEGIERVARTTRNTLSSRPWESHRLADYRDSKCRF